MSAIDKIVSKNILEEIERKGFKSLRSFALKAGVSYTGLVKIVRQNEPIGEDRLVKIAKALGVAPEALYQTGDVNNIEQYVTSLEETQKALAALVERLKEQTLTSEEKTFLNILRNTRTPLRQICLFFLTGEIRYLTDIDTETRANIVNLLESLLAKYRLEKQQKD